MLYNKWWKNTGDVCTRQVSFYRKPKKREKKLIFVLIYRIKAKTPKLIR